MESTLKNEYCPSYIFESLLYVGENITQYLHFGENMYKNILSPFAIAFSTSPAYTGIVSNKNNNKQNYQCARNDNNSVSGSSFVSSFYRSSDGTL